MARKRRKKTKRRPHRKARQRRVYRPPKPKKKRLLSRAVRYGDVYRSRVRQIHKMYRPERMIFGRLGYEFRKRQRRQRRLDSRDKGPERRYRDEHDYYKYQAQELVRRDRVCRRRVGRRIALFALGKAGMGKSVRGIRRWTRDSSIRC